MDMLPGNGHSAWTWSMDTDIDMDMDIDIDIDMDMNIDMDVDIRGEIKNKQDFRRSSAQPHRRGLLIKKNM
jgi:hypothetical protein